MHIHHPALADLLRRAYSAEKAAAFAYQGHAESLKDLVEKQAVQQIEKDEWEHRENVRVMMDHYAISVSSYYELKFHLIGKIISFSCHVIGRFMPYFFAGKLESGNVCEYFLMMRYFQSLGIHTHDEVLYQMGIKEKEHEMHFLKQIRDKPLLPIFEKLFSWGLHANANDVHLESMQPLAESNRYCLKENKKNSSVL